MSPDRLAQLAREHLELKAKIKKLDAKAKHKQDAIIAELNRRDMDGMEWNGVRIRKVEQPMTIHHLAKYKEHLSPALFKKVLKLQVDPGKVQALLMAGKITPETLDACSEVKPKAPYIVVTEVEDD